MLCDSIIIDGVLYNYSITPNNIQIEDSCKIRKKYFATTLERIEELHLDTEVWKRSKKSLKREWATHNLLYSFDIHRDRTKDVDLNYPCKWEWLYNIVGAIALIIIK